MNSADMKDLCLVTVMALMIAAKVQGQGTNNNATEAQQFLELYNTEAQKIFSAHNEIYWTFITNITEENRNMTVSQIKNTEWCILILQVRK